MSPRPDRRSDSRPDRGARRPGGGPSGRPPGRGPGRPGSPPRAGGGGSRRPGWGASDGGAGGDRSRPRRDEGQPLGEWTPRGREGDGGAPRRFDGPRFGDRRSESGRPEGGRPDERRWERRSERGGRFERRPEQGRPPRPLSSRAPEGAGPGRFVPRSGPRPRPPAELVGYDRRPAGPPGRPGRPGDTPEGENFAGAAPSDLIWGRHSSQAVLESGRPIHRIWCTPEMRFSPRFLQLLREAKAGGVLVEEVTWARLGQISGGAVHQGIVLQPAAAETLDLASLIDGCRSTGESPLLIAVDGLTDPQNLGAIVRSAEALGAHGLVLPQRRNAGLTGSVAKVAAGALEHLPVARVVNLNRSLETLKEEGYRVVGLASEGTVTLEEVDLDGPLVVVTGSEGDGLSLLTRRHCDQLVRIPLRGTTPSLNASVATALLLYEIARRGWMQGLRGTSPAPRLVRPAMPTSAPALDDTAAPSPEPQDTTPETVLAASGGEPDGESVGDASAMADAGRWQATVGEEPAAWDASVAESLSPEGIEAEAAQGQPFEAAPSAGGDAIPVAGESSDPEALTEAGIADAARSWGGSDSESAASGWPGSGDVGETPQAGTAAFQEELQQRAQQPEAPSDRVAGPGFHEGNASPQALDLSPESGQAGGAFSFDDDIRL